MRAASRRVELSGPFGAVRDLGLNRPTGAMGQWGIKVRCPAPLDLAV